MFARMQGSSSNIHNKEVSILASVSHFMSTAAMHMLTNLTHLNWKGIARLNW